MSDPYNTTERGTGYHQQYPIIPPPPPPEWIPKKRERPWTVTALLSFVVTFALLSAVGGTVYWINYQSGAKPAIDANYTATDILSDFGKDGCPCGYAVEYGTSISVWSDGNYPVSIQASSSAAWSDPGQTQEAASIGLWVYGNLSDAQSAYVQIGNDEMSPSTTWPEYMKPAEYLHGRCLLLITGYSSTTGPWLGYQQALDKYCV